MAMIRIPIERRDDLVRVVRCEDCKYHEDEQIGMVYCPSIVGGWVKDDWFCADGERKEDGKENI